MSGLVPAGAYCGSDLAKSAPDKDNRPNYIERINAKSVGLGMDTPLRPAIWSLRLGRRYARR